MGQVEPIPALVAVFVVGAGLTTYVVVLDDSLPESRDRQVSSHAADRLEAEVSGGGVVRPTRLDAASDTTPEGYDVNATLITDGGRWTTGPRPPQNADETTRQVSVRLEPGNVSSGRLRVAVWS